MNFLDGLTDFLSFGVNDDVGNGRRNREDDVKRVKGALRDTGHFPEDREITGIIDRDTDAGIKRFQRDHGLRVDGLIRPEGETARVLQGEAERTLQTGRILRRRDEASEEPEASISNRFFGGLQALGGIGQAAIGAAGVAAPEPLTTIGGLGLMGLGADNVATGARQVFTGRPEQTATRQGLEAAARAVGADELTAARLADGAEIGINLVGPAGVGRGAARAAGFDVTFGRFPNRRSFANMPGFGVTVRKDGKRVFGADVHNFTIKEGGTKKEVVEPHLHFRRRGPDGKTIPGQGIGRHRRLRRHDLFLPR